MAEGQDVGTTVLAEQLDEDTVPLELPPEAEVLKNGQVVVMTVGHVEGYTVVPEHVLHEAVGHDKGPGIVRS